MTSSQMISLDYNGGWLIPSNSDSRYCAAQQDKDENAGLPSLTKDIAANLVFMKSPEIQKITVICKEYLCDCGPALNWRLNLHRLCDQSATPIVELTLEDYYKNYASSHFDSVTYEQFADTYYESEHKSSEDEFEFLLKLSRLRDTQPSIEELGTSPSTVVSITEEPSGCKEIAHHAASAAYSVSSCSAYVDGVAIISLSD